MVKAVVLWVTVEDLKVRVQSISSSSTLHLRTIPLPKP